MAISDNIREVYEKIKREYGTGKTPTGNKVRKKSVAAIMAGASSEEWKDYMKLFAKNEAELARLMPEPNPKNKRDIARRNLARAYLVGNGPCGADSVTGAPLDYGIGNVLDSNNK
jgi:hypothetical protein